MCNMGRMWLSAELLSASSLEDQTTLEGPALAENWTIKKQFAAKANESSMLTVT